MTFDELKAGIKNWKLTRDRMLHLVIGLAAVLVYEFWARPIYRPYIYRNKINDFHSADTIGNTLGTIATVFVLIGLIGQGREQHLFLIKTITIAVALYEIAHPLLGKPMDLWDVLATLLTGGFCLILYRVLHPKS
jgi:RsiW-degrading membrane proteinase PrsW (M82 family)